MSAKHLGDELLVGVLASLGCLGFKKSARTLVRQAGAFEERYRLQGSHWNSGVEPYKFYLGISMRLTNVPLPTLQEGSKLPDRPEVRRWAHSSGRQRCVDSNAPLWLEVTNGRLNETVNDLVERITLAGNVLQRCEQIVRQAALQGEYIPLWKAVKLSMAA